MLIFCRSDEKFDGVCQQLQVEHKWLWFISCLAIQEEYDFEFVFRYTEIDCNDFAVGRPFRCNTNKLLKEIDDFRFENRYPSRSAATLELIRLGMEALKKEQKKVQKRSRLPLRRQASEQPFDGEDARTA